MRSQALPLGIYSVYSLFRDFQMMTTAPAEQQLAITPASDDEIDLRQVAGALGRRWPWIAGGGALGLRSLRALPAHHQAGVSG